MRTIVEIQKIGLSKLNNAEYLNLLTRTGSFISAAGAEALGVEADVVERFEAQREQLSLLVERSYTSAETAEMTELDKQRDALGLYILDSVRNAQNVPIASKAEAAKALWIELKPYEKFYAEPNQQETMKVNGMIRVLCEEENAPHVATLGLTDYLAELSSVNARYQILTDQRTMAIKDNKMDDSATQRKELDVLYDYIMKVAFCESVAKPTEVTAEFVGSVNAVIEEIDELYNLRVGKKKEEKEETETPENPEEDTTVE